MLPLKGRYAISKDAEMGNKFKMLVYPVPVKGAFHLGVHSTLNISGHVKLGPTIFPAFSPENYDNADGITPRGLFNTLKSYAHVAKSPKTRGLIKMFMASELQRSVSIKKLVNDCKQF